MPDFQPLATEIAHGISWEYTAPEILLMAEM
jgi:hypothetical protein